jgi:hypothetical protein
MNDAVYPPKLLQIEDPVRGVPTDLARTRSPSSQPSDPVPVGCQTREQGGPNQASRSGDHQVKV